MAQAATLFTSLMPFTSNNRKQVVNSVIRQQVQESFFYMWRHVLPRRGM